MFPPAARAGNADPAIPAAPAPAAGNIERDGVSPGVADIGVIPKALPAAGGDSGGRSSGRE